PEAGEAAWSERAARRKGRVDFRLAFVPSKFRLAAEPEPFCLELHLPKDEPWTLHEVTDTLIQAGKEAVNQADKARDERLQQAADALVGEIAQREHHPMTKTEAEEFLVHQPGITRTEARQLLQAYNGKSWRLSPIREGRGKYTAYEIVPV